MNSKNPFMVVIGVVLVGLLLLGLWYVLVRTEDTGLDKTECSQAARLDEAAVKCD